MQKYKYQICYCKKSLYQYFEEGKFYEFYFEEDFSEMNDSVWVIYNKKGELGKQGFRFHNPTISKKISSLSLFKEYFDYGKVIRLRKLQEIEKTNQKNLNII